MEIKSLLERFLRFSWQAGDDPMDSTIRSSLIGEHELDRSFERPAPRTLVQAIALPLIMTMAHSENPLLNETNPWRMKLTREERREVVRYYGLHNDHRLTWHMVQNESQIRPMAAWVAASFAYTTQHAAIVMPMENLISEIFQSYEGDTRALIFAKKTDLLIVTDPVGNYKGLSKISGNVRSVFSKRMAGRHTMFLSTAFPQIAEMVAGGAEPTRSHVVELVNGSPIGAFFEITSYLTGDSTYINFNTENPLRRLNECRSELSV